MRERPNKTVAFALCFVFTTNITTAEPAYTTTLPVQIPAPPAAQSTDANAAEPTVAKLPADLENLTDPTKPVNFKPGLTGAKGIKAKAIELQMIAYRAKGGSWAVISGQRLKEGDNFEDTTIQKIEEDRVIFSNPARKPLQLDYATLSIKQREGTQP